MSKCLEILGIVFGVIGFIAAIVTSILPMWKVTANSWEGLLRDCDTQHTDQMQCKIHDLMIVISIILGILGVLISIVGAKCMKRGAATAKVMIISGIFFILAGVLVLVPVCWSAHTLNAESEKIGTSLYVGWASAALFLIGGAMLCCRCHPKEEKYIPKRVTYTKTEGTKIETVFEKR